MLPQEAVVPAYDRAAVARHALPGTRVAPMAGGSAGGRLPDLQLSDPYFYPQGSLQRTDQGLQLGGRKLAT